VGCRRRRAVDRNQSPGPRRSVVRFPTSEDGLPDLVSALGPRRDPGMAKETYALAMKLLHDLEPAENTRRLVLIRCVGAAAFLGLLAFALWTREPGRREGVWRDEALSVYVACAPSVPKLIRRNQVADYNPPLFNLILAGYGRVVSFEEGDLKLLAIVLGLAALASVAALAYAIRGGLAALIATAFAINTPIVIAMSTELRPYSLSACLCAMSLLLVLRIRAKKRDTVYAGSFVLLIVLLILLVYAHIAGGIVTAVLCFWGFYEWRAKPSSAFGKRLMLSAGFAGGTFLFWVPTTWRQFRMGIPYEKQLSVSQDLGSLVYRLQEGLPMPYGLTQPVVLVGIAALGMVAILGAPRVGARLRELKVPLGVATIAGAVIWLVIGLFARDSRYLMIPAVLCSVVLAVMVRVVLEVGLAARPVLRGVAGLGAAALVVGSFLSRADFYADSFARRDLPKSGIRSVCRNRQLNSNDLVVVAPDYLALTVWYYCGRREDLHGFVRWDGAVLLDLKNYAKRWSDPSAVADAVSKIEATLRRSGRSAFELVFDDTQIEPPLQYGLRVRKFRAELARLFNTTLIGQFPGRIESVKAMTLIQK
jgi:hypothetical protein